MVKCKDCGFLSLVRRENGELASANASYCTEGFQAYQRDEVFPVPNCYVREHAIHLEPLEAEGIYVKLVGEMPGLISLENKEGADVTDLVILKNIGRERQCEKFTNWLQGFSPKEHMEMLDKQFIMEREDRRDKDQKEWLERQGSRTFNKQVIVFGVLVTLALITSQIFAAFAPIIWGD